MESTTDNENYKTVTVNTSYLPKQKRIGSFTVGWLRTMKACQNESDILEFVGDINFLLNAQHQVLLGRLLPFSIKSTLVVSLKA